MATIDISDSDSVYFYDETVSDGDYTSSDTIAFSDDQYVDYGFYNFTRPFYARVHNNFVSYAVIQQEL